MMDLGVRARGEAPRPVLTWENVEILPVLHGVMEAAVAVRQVMWAREFDHVAVELPPTIRTQLLLGVARLPALSVIHFPRREGTRYFLVEPTEGLTEAVRSAREERIPVHLIDLDTEEFEEHRDSLPDPYAARRIGWNAYCGAYLKHTRGEGAPSGRERCMAHHLQRLNSEGGRVLFVCGLYHAKRMIPILREPQPHPLGRQRRENVGLSHLDADSAREVASEPAYLRERYEVFRKSSSMSAAEEPLPEDPPPASLDRRLLDPPDRLEELVRLYRVAAGDYEREDKRKVSVADLSVAVRFARNWALLEGRLSPELYHAVVAARGVADDDFAYRTWDAATRSEVQEASYDLPTMKLTFEDLGRSGRLMRFRRRLKQRRRMLRVLRPRPKEAYPGQWKELWEPGAICSYPPEDLSIENFGGYLKSRAHRVLSEESVRVEPFEAQLGDGIDLRETVRNWHEGRLYVKHKRPVRGKVGALVVILDSDDSGPERYTWKLTWQGEHHDESDMAFYATPMGKDLVGPGIARSEYGGFLMTYPPGRMFHVWEDPYFDVAETKPERLLLAALDYCEDEMVVYVDQHPPSRRYQMLASRFGKKLYYLPLGQISPVTLARIRFFHILSGHYVRTYAQEFIE